MELTQRPGAVVSLASGAALVLAAAACGETAGSQNEFKPVEQTNYLQTKVSLFNRTGSGASLMGQWG